MVKHKARYHQIWRKVQLCDGTSYANPLLLSNIVDRWVDVTCKRCLKLKRKKKSGKET